MSDTDSKFTKTSDKGNTLEEWWPERLSLRVLRQNSPDSNPMGRVRDSWDKPYKSF